ncbi:MFS transporter [Fodinisporobacter ferrooxydans]|uniref:MFS transporter n=1 Tax=Fodinisporobacter ferrooxydans TaxID=2901836 RepID=A0ABY4CNM2_9BACL|nr:MFS transporter [Alicyclobacillaceae bacterium MYW30-H2]
MSIRGIQLILQTLSLFVGFMVWVILSSLMPFIKEDIPLTPTQITWVTAVPVILGSVLRLPVGFWTNRFGARKMFVLSLIILVFPVYYLSIAHSFVDLIIGGFLLGIGGAIFSVGVTSLPKYYPREKHGFVNGIYGAGNIGTAITAFTAPIVANHFGWSFTIRLFLALLALFAVLNFFFGDKLEQKEKVSFTGQVRSVYRNELLWFLGLFYFITFGSFVAFTVYLPNFLVAHFHLAKVDAGFRTAGFIVLATLLRPVGGWMGDRWDSLKVLSFVFGGFTIAAILLSFMPSITLYTLGCLTIAMCAGIGNGAVFKLVPTYFRKQAGIANGIVSAMGGLGGFFPPLILTILFNLTGSYSIGFMALSEVALASVVIAIWIYHQNKLQLAEKIINHTVEGIMVTDTSGVIQSVNQSFVSVTGFDKKEVIGKKPSILKSGKQNQEFYKSMWEKIYNQGYWQGEIWNRRKNGEVYPEWLTISTVKNEGNEVEYYIGMFSDLSKLKK